MILGESDYLWKLEVYSYYVFTTIFVPMNTNVCVRNNIEILKKEHKTGHTQDLCNILVMYVHTVPEL